MNRPSYLAFLVILAVPIITTPKVASQQPPKKQEQSEQQPSQLQTNASPNVNQGSQQESQSGDKDKEKNKCKTKGVWNWFLQFSARNDKAIVAISTLFIAAFTGLLFVATILLWHGGERHSRRELRAYLSVRPKLILNFGSELPVGVDCTITNYGQTPAFEINHVFGAGVFPPGFRELPNASIQIRGDTALFPSVEMSTHFFGSRLTAVEVADVENGTRRIYFWGTTTYRDAFRKRRYTRFSASAGGQDLAESTRAQREGRAARDFRWVWEHRHNEAT